MCQLMKFAILLSVAFFVFGTCNTKKTVRKVEIPEEELLSEPLDYSSIGLVKLSEYGFFEGALSDLKPADKATSLRNIQELHE